MASGELISVGVIGAGHFGSYHARIYDAMPNVHLAGIADINMEAARVVAERHRCEAFDDPSAFLGKTDAVSVVVPTVYHRAVAMPYLEAGMAVLLEKPLAATLEDARAIVEAAEANGAFLLPGYLERFNPAFRKIMGELNGAPPQFMDFRRLGRFSPRASDVDVVTDLMIHDLDLAMALAGSQEINFIHALGASVLTSHADLVNARLEFGNGSIANFTASRLAVRNARILELFDDAHHFILNFNSQKLHVHAPKGTDKIITDIIKVEPARPLNAELAYFIEETRRGSRRPVVSGRKALRSLELALEIIVQVRQRAEKNALIAAGGA